MKTIPKIGCVQHDCDECKQLREQNTMLDAKLAEIEAQPEQPAPGAVAGKKMQVTLQDSPVDVEIARYKRMFESACFDLGLINEALGLDPDDGGAEPILGAIAALKAVIAQPEQEAANTLKSAREIGENGTPHRESERLLFEEYMRGHNWKCDSWNPDKAEYYDSTQRIFYAVFRARAAIAQPEQDVDYWIKQHTEARQAELELRRELESLKTVQEPVAYMHFTDEGDMCMWSRSSPESIEDAMGVKPIPLYTSPPQRQPLTDEEIWQMVNDCVIGGDLHAIKYGRAIEAAHGIKEAK